MFQDTVTAIGSIDFMPGYTTVGLLVWLLVILGLVGFLVSLFRG